MKEPQHQGENVISLADHRSRLIDPAMTEIEAYWEGLRNGRLMPLRSEVNPRGMVNALHNAFILERIAPGLARFRVAGGHLTDLMGIEVRGMPLSSVFAPEARTELGQLLETVFEHPASLRLKVTGVAGLTTATLEGEMLILPLRSDFGDVSRAIGCLVTHGAIGRAPRRLVLGEHRIHRLTGPVSQETSAPVAPAPAPDAEPGPDRFEPIALRRDIKQSGPVLTLVSQTD